MSVSDCIRVDAICKNVREHCIIGDVGTYACRAAMRCDCGGFACVPQTDARTVRINLTESRLLTVVIASVLFELRFKTNEGH